MEYLALFPLSHMLALHIEEVGLLINKVMAYRGTIVHTERGLASNSVTI